MFQNIGVESNAHINNELIQSEKKYFSFFSLVLYCKVQDLIKNFDFFNALSIIIEII
jgi:hypothetical protein